MNAKREASLTLELLQAIDDRSDLTQRHLADRLGVALGLANSYLKRCVRKGLVKIQQAPANRYLYYLTPQGFAEKSRLTAEYLSASFDFYRRASDSMVRALGECEAAGTRQVIFCGISELAEIASVRSHDFSLQVLGTFDPALGRANYLGKPVWSAFDDAPVFDAVVLTGLRDCRGLRARALAERPAARIVVPDIVGALLAVESVAA